jgi:hypothetical protein
VTVRFDDGKVEIRSARPNAGYEMRVASNGPGEVLVYFWKQGRFSEVRASYKDGEPSTTVNEWVCSGSYPDIRCRQQT